MSDDNDDQNEGSLERNADASEDAGETTTTTTTAKRKRKRKRNKNKSKDNDDHGDDANNNSNGHATATGDPGDMTSCTVYVVGIPFDASPDDVKGFFTSNGIADVVEMRLPTWQDSGRLRGYGHVVLENTKDYDAALALSGKYMGKRYLTIEPCKAPKSGNETSFGAAGARTAEPPSSDCKTLFVGNLPYSATEAEIIEVFEAFGALSDVGGGVRIARNSVTRQSKGFCYVDYEDPSSAQKAVEASLTSRITVGGRVARIDYDSGRMKGSYRAESGRLWNKSTKDEGEGDQSDGHGKRRK